MSPTSIQPLVWMRANVSMALRSGSRPLWFQAIAWARLPLQVPLILGALRVGREPGR